MTTATEPRCAKPPAGAWALTAFRALPNGTGRPYTATTFPRDPWQGCEWAIRRAAAIGHLAPSSGAPSYAVLDVPNEDGDIIADYDIPTAKAFRYWKRTMGWAVEPNPEEQA